MLKILTVDDEKTSKIIMNEIFSKYGSCTYADKGLNAIELYLEAFENNEPFDLIILDYSLGHMSGLDILEQIRNNENEKKIPKKDRSIIIMVTSHNKMSIAKKCIAAGCDNYILKPLNPATIREKLLTLEIKPLEGN